MRRMLALAAFCVAHGTAAGADGEWRVGSGVDYSRGTYGGSIETTIVSVPLSVRYQSEPWTLKLTVPYLEVTGASSVIPGFGSVDRRNRRGSGAAQSSASGIGDSTLTATYAAYYDAASRTAIDLTGKLKVATGDESAGLGTGSNDVSAQVDAYRALERFTVYGSVGYTVFGSSPIVDLHNVLYGSAGLTRRVSESDTLGAEVDLRQGASPAPLAQRELMGFVTHRLDRSWRAQAYLVKGFANGSPDWGAGLSAAYSF